MFGILGTSYIRNYRPENGYEVAAYTKRKHPEWRAARILNEKGRLTPAQSLMFADRKPSEELYALDVDPYETQNLAEQAGHAQVLSRMRKALDQWIASNPNDPLVNFGKD